MSVVHYLILSNQDIVPALACSLNLDLLFWFSFYGHTCSIWKFQARGQIRAAAADLCYSHSNVGFELHLQPTP